MRNAFSTPEAFSAFEGLLTSTSHANSKDKGLSRTWQAFVEPDDENDDSFCQRYLLTENPLETWTFQEIQDLTSAMDTPGCRNNTQVASQEFVAVNIKFSFLHLIAAHRTIQHLASTLHSTIIETFLDCAPSVFSPNSTPSETEVDLVLTVAHVVRTLYHVVLPSSVCGDFFSYHYSSIHLVFRSTLSTRNAWKASLIICHLTFLPSKTTRRLVFFFWLFYDQENYSLTRSLTGHMRNLTLFSVKYHLYL